MEFLEIEENQRGEWNDFLLHKKPEAFLQSFEWGEFQKSVGRKIFRFAVLDENKIIAVALAVEHKLRFGIRYWYIPRGPVCSFYNRDLSDFLISGIEKIAKENGVIFVRMDPAEKLGDKKPFGVNMKKVTGSVQPKDTMILNLDPSEESLLSKMKAKTRYNIRLAEKKGVGIFHSDFSEENFEAFWKLVCETSSRDGIVSHKKEYYQKMLEILEQEKGLHARLYFAKYQEKAIATNIMLFFGNYAVYLHGASSNESRNVMAPYLLQWRQVCDAKEIGCAIYDFWGITIDNENPRWGGITRFKEGFGGEAVRYIGVYELPINHFKYKIYNLLKSLNLK